MNKRIVLLAMIFIIALCIMPVIATPTPTPTVTPSAPLTYPGTIKWVDDNKATITSAYLGKNITFVFDTVTAGIDPPNENLDKYMIAVYKKDMQSNLWEFVELPGVYKLKTGETTYTLTAGGDFINFNGYENKGFKTYTSANPLYPTNVTIMRATLFGGNLTSGNYYLVAQSDVSLTKNPLLASNLGDWLKRIGGDGLAYLVAVIIIIALACVPYLILKQMNVFLEMIMMALGLGISYFANLIPIWVPFGIGICLVAVFILMRHREV